MSTDLVGPLEPVTFHHGAFTSSVRYFPQLPKNTCDPRASTCFDHHLACDCREALLAEDITEHRIAWREHREQRDALRAVALLHRPRTEHRETYCLSCLAAWPCPTSRIVRPLIPVYDLPEESR